MKLIRVCIGQIRIFRLFCGIKKPQKDSKCNNGIVDFSDYEQRFQDAC